jgi:hypothetical protein
MIVSGQGLDAGTNESLLDVEPQKRFGKRSLVTDYNEEPGSKRQRPLNYGVKNQANQYVGWHFDDPSLRVTARIIRGNGLTCSGLFPDGITVDTRKKWVKLCGTNNKLAFAKVVLDPTLLPFVFGGYESLAAEDRKDAILNYLRSPKVNSIEEQDEDENERIEKDTIDEVKLSNPYVCGPSLLVGTHSLDPLVRIFATCNKDSSLVFGPNGYDKRTSNSKRRSRPLVKFNLVKLLVKFDKGNKKKSKEYIRCQVLDLRKSIGM